MTAPTPAAPPSASETHNSGPLWVAWGCASLWFGLHAWGPAGPPRAVWGIDMWEPWPVEVRWLVAAVLSACLLPPVLRRWVAGVHRALAPWSGRDLSRRLRAVMAVGFAVLCWFGRTGNIYHGDGIVVAKIARSNASLLHYVGYSDGRATAEQVVEFLIHRGANALLGPALGLEAYDTIALTHAACGGVMLWLLTGLFATWWPSHGRRQLAAMALFCSLGVIQLWFGHLETYTIGSTAFVGFLWAGSRALRDRTGLWEPALWATVAMTVHTVFGGALLGLAWVWFVRTKAAPVRTRVAQGLWLAAPIVVALLAVVMAYRALGFTGDMIAGFFERRGMEEGATLVPLFETANVLERYTFMSRAHMVDLLNESALTAVYALPLLLGLGVAFRTRPFRGDPLPLFLLASTVVYGLVIVVINPPGGGRREWDVFSPPAVGYGLLAIYALVNAVRVAHIRRGVAGVCFVAAIAHTGPWIANNARIDLPRYIEHRAAGDRARHDGLTRIALLEWEQALAILPSPDLAVRIGDAHRVLGKDEAARIAYTQSVQWENRSELAAFGEWEHALVALGELAEGRGDDGLAGAHFSEALRVGTERKNPQADRAAVYEGLGRIATRAGEDSAAGKWRERAREWRESRSER